MYKRIKANTNGKKRSPGEDDVDYYRYSQETFKLGVYEIGAGLINQ